MLFRGSHICHWLSCCSFNFTGLFCWSMMQIKYLRASLFLRAPTLRPAKQSAWWWPRASARRLGRSATRWRPRSRTGRHCSRSWTSLVSNSPRSSRSSASPCGSLTSATSTTLCTVARGSAAPSTTSRLPWHWRWRPSQRACPPSSLPAWHWAHGAWPRRTPSYAPCPPWRRWAAPPSSAPTRRAPSPPTRCPSAGWVCLTHTRAGSQAGTHVFVTIGFALAG